MLRKKIILYCTFSVLVLFAAFFVWRQGPYMYHLVRYPGRPQIKKEESGVPAYSFISTRPTPGAVYYKNKVITLMYHDVSQRPINDKSLDTAVFEEQLQAMKANGFHWITMEQYADFVTRHQPVPDNAVLMTFDDGYETFYTNVFPILKKYHVPATNFLIVSTVGNPKHPGLPKLTWAQVKLMHRSGIDFYSHTFDSHAYAYVRPEGKSHDRLEPMLMGPEHNKTTGHVETEQEYIRRVKGDLTRADQILRNEIGNRRDILAFPYGGYTQQVLGICRNLGIQVVFTVKPGIDGPGQYMGYRVNAGGMDNNPIALIESMKHAESLRGYSKAG